MERVVVKNVSKKFKIGFKKNQGTLERATSILSGREPKQEIWALKDVSFTAHTGEIVGIIGPNGSGKSTLLRVIAGIHDKDSGTVEINGNLISLIGLSIGLKERLTMKENIYLCCSLFGLSQQATKERADSITEFAELENFINTKIYQFSEGMKQRLAFSIAMHCDPEILLLDEVFEIGDDSFKTKSIEKIKELMKSGTTILLATHYLDIVKRHLGKQCDKILLMEEGEHVVFGNTRSAMEKDRSNV